jgi:two-component system, chemotaxis family, chemotaxis protein CheY
MKALIVEDSKVLRLHLRTIMQSLGWSTDEVENGKRALELLRGDSDFSLVLIDVNMPVMNGIECVRRVRSELPQLDLKLMMVTTESSFAMIAETLGNGADEFLMKPFTRENLLAKLSLMSLPVAV